MAAERKIRDFDLRGKDYFTFDEAAHYCCVSPDQFRKKATNYRLCGRYFMGKLVFRRADCQAAIENEWRRLDNAARPGISGGARAGRRTSTA